MSIPTSLIIVVLVAAWLAVLVPMAARRREAVPETEVDGGTFRVLRRASASIRRRPRFTRRDVVVDEEYLDALDDADALESHQLPGDEISTEELDEELLDGEADELDDEEFEDRRFEEVRYEEVQYEEVQYEEVQYEERQYAEVGAIHRPAARSRCHGRRLRRVRLGRQTRIRPNPPDVLRIRPDARDGIRSRVSTRRSCGLYRDVTGAAVSIRMPRNWPGRTGIPVVVG